MNMPHPSLERLDEIAALTARAEKAEAEAAFWKAAYDRCNVRVCELLEEKIAVRAFQQNAEDGK